MIVRDLAIIGALGLVLASCSSSSAPDDAASAPPGFRGLFEDDTAPAAPALDVYQIAAGEKLYAENCASCHRADLSGDPNWMIPDENGVYPPPPHDATGHTWHHDDGLLLGIIRDGLEGFPSGMPTFTGILTDDGILSILEFLKSNWGDEERTFQWQATWREQESRITQP
jgi:mono/diheme cytochrome c family protein